MPCQNELDENWGDEDGENCFCFFRHLFTKSCPKEQVSKCLTKKIHGENFVQIKHLYTIGNLSKLRYLK